MRISKYLTFILILSLGLWWFAGVAEESKLEFKGLPEESTVQDRPSVKPTPPAEAPEKLPPPAEAVEVIPITIATKTPAAKSPVSKSVFLSVPFAAQAPFGEWSDPRQQDGCEEAAALMAVYWAKGETSLTKDKAKNEIIAISDYEEEIYENYHDTSAKDTLTRIINGYFDYDNAEYKAGVDLDYVKEQLALGNVVIMPANGRVLHNPNYTAPGPEHHNILIKGWDARAQEFVTNDPGTRSGESYRYSEATIAAAWRDYPTGSHESATSTLRSLIVVRPEKP